MPKPFINIKELAQALKLSTSTVSRACRDKSDINPETKKCILHKAKELGYYPNIYVSNLRDSKSRMIAVIMPEPANKAVKGIEKVAQDNGYHMLLIYVRDSRYEKEVSIIEDLYNGLVEGSIMSVSKKGADHYYIKKLKSRNALLAFFDQVNDDIEVPKVITDDYERSYRPISYFLQRGITRIALLVIDKNASIGNAALQGYITDCRKCGVPLDENLIIDYSNDFDQTYDVIKKTLKGDSPEVLSASVERLATAAYQVCLDEQAQIPEQVKIISFSNLSIGGLLKPSLSTIKQPAEELGTRYNGVSAIYALLRPRITRLTNKRVTHTLSLLVGGISLISIYFIQSKYGLILPMVGIGMAWGSILASTLPPRKMGVYRGIFNFFVLIPQMLNGIFGGLMLKHFYHGDGRGIYATRCPGNAENSRK